MYRGSFLLPTNLRHVAKFRESRCRDGLEVDVKHDGPSLLHRGRPDNAVISQSAGVGGGSLRLSC